MNKFWIVILTILSFVLSFVAVESYDQFSTRVFLTSLVIQFISIYNIFSKNEPFSLFKIFYLFSLFFFGIAPLLQFYGRIQLFGARPLLENEYFYINNLVLVIVILYKLLYNYFYKKNISTRLVNISEFFYINHKLQIKHLLILLLISLFSFLMVFKINNFNLFSMLVRGGEMKEFNISSSTNRLITYRFFQPLSIMVFFYYLISPHRKLYIVWILGIIGVLTCFPMGMPRFSAAAIYIPFVLIVFPWLRKKNVFSLIFILGLLVVFPFLNNFRNYSADKVNLRFDYDIFIEGSFDSYQNLALVVLENITTWGNQLVGVLLFWIPRNYWPNKPVGSGQLLAQELNFEFTNVSCNYFAEGYINFGYTGILIFLVVFAIISAKVDKLYWLYLVKEKHNFLNIFYYVLLGMLFFILRGDLMSAFAFTMGFLLSIFVITKITPSK